MTYSDGQAEAQALAVSFNRRVSGPAAWAVSFLDCVVFHVRDSRYPGGSVRVLAEQELEGRFTKWNNNAGAVRPRRPGGGTGGLGAIGEDSDDGGSEEEEAACGGRRGVGAAVEVGDVPQCFSHFTYEATEGRRLVCDLQVGRDAGEQGWRGKRRERGAKEDWQG